jgi:N utilization substance protein B
MPPRRGESKASMIRRSRAREVALQLLYRDELNETGDESSDRSFLRTRLAHHAGLVRFAWSLVEGVRQRREHLDRMLAPVIENWSLDRLAAVDRNILRIATWEMRFGDTPARVAVNEAIELAKRYGDRDSPRFINGVLDRLMQTPWQPQTLDALLGSTEPPTSREG